MTGKALTLHTLSFLAWCASVWTTQEFLQSINVSGSTTLSGGLTLQWAWVVAALVQAVFTEIENPIWYKQVSIMRVLVLALDVLINAAGMWRWIINMGESNVSQMLNDVQGTSEAAATAAATADPDMLVMFGWSLFFGVLLALTPEYLKMTANMYNGKASVKGKPA